MAVASLIDEVELGARLRAGDEDALDEIWKTICPPIWRRLSRAFHALSEDRAEHLALIALLALWQRRAKFRPEPGALRALLWKIAKHKAVKFLRLSRQKSRRMEVALDPDRLAELCVRDEMGEADGRGVQSVQERDALLHDGLAMLPKTHEFVLRADMNSTTGVAPSDDLAAELGVSVTTVRSHRHRGKKKIKTVLLDLGIEKFIGVQRPGTITNRGIREPPGAARNGERGTGQLIVASTNSVLQWRNAFRDAIPTILTRVR